ncbi:hypothetical protein M9458_030080, partial [Cirrhinus mrigala]
PHSSLWLPDSSARWEQDARPERRMGPQQSKHTITVRARGRQMCTCNQTVPYTSTRCLSVYRPDDEYEFAYDDEPSPSPQGYGGTPNPQTPGYPEVPSPQVNPQYNPQTPGTPA